MAPEKGPPRFILGVQVFNPSHGFGVGDLSKITLGGRKVRMPEDHLANNFDGNARSRGIGGGVAAEIMWPEGNADHLTGFGHDHSGCFIRNRKNPVFSGLAPVGRILPEPVCNFLRNEHHLSFPAAFRLP